MTPKTGLDSAREETARVKSMFNAIAHRYDFLNHFLSFGLDIRWRKKAISALNQNKPYPKILDLACGTGDFAIETARRLGSVTIGADIALNMIRAGKNKMQKNKIRMLSANGENLPLKANAFDAVTIAFGIRNMENRDKSLSEMSRILNPGGECVILEFSLPESTVLKKMYLFYFKQILPLLGGLISGHAEAYKYLPASVAAFPDPDQFIMLMQKNGFDTVEHFSLFFGVAAIYKGLKTKDSQ